MEPFRWNEQDKLPLGTNRHSVENDVRARRRHQGISLRELARRASVSPSELSQIERGLTAPSIYVAYALALTLGCQVQDLFPPPPR